MITVRRAETRDIKEIVELIRNYHDKDLQHNKVPFKVMHTVEFLSDKIRDKHCLINVSVYKDKVQGLVIANASPYFYNNSHRWITDELIIAKSGGKALIQSVIDWSVRIKANLYIGVSSLNDKADSILESMGLTRVGGMYYLPYLQEK